MNRSMIRHGFVLMLLALVGGFFVPVMEIPRLAVSAHTIGVLSGVLLIAVGAIWQQFVLTSGQATLMYWSWLKETLIYSSRLRLCQQARIKARF